MSGMTLGGLFPEADLGAAWGSAVHGITADSRRVAPTPMIDVVVMWRKLKKLLIAKYGEQSVAKGMRTGSYAWSRAIQLRRWRLPKPRYKKRGHWPK